MLDFDAPAVSFKVKGQLYWLEPITFADIPRVGAALKMDDIAAQAAELIDMIASKAHCDVPEWRLRLMRKPTPAEAVKSLSIPQQAALTGEWLGDLRARGVVPGESSGSAT